MFDRFIWVFFRRLSLMFRCRGFKASLRSFASSDCVFYEYAALHGNAAVRSSTINRFTYLSDAKVNNSIVGSFCSIGHQAIVGGLGKHPVNWLSTHPVFYSDRQQVSLALCFQSYFEESLPVIIGNDVWVGARAIILDGISVGHGAIIAAGSIVTKNVPPYAIVGGVPARIIRYRFDAREIDLLLETKWWEWPVSKIKAMAHIIRTSDVNNLVEMSRCI